MYLSNEAVDVPVPEVLWQHSLFEHLRLPYQEILAIGQPLNDVVVVGNLDRERRTESR